MLRFDWLLVWFYCGFEQRMIHIYLNKSPDYVFLTVLIY